MTPPVFKHFLERRKEKPFLKRSKQATANKKCVGEGPSHHFGSISASQHAAKMMKRTGKLPTTVELYLEGHSKLVDGTRILSTQKHQEVYDAFQARRRNMAADLGEVYNDEVDEQILNDNQIFLDASGGFKKGQGFSLGTAAKLYYDTPSEARTTPKASSYVPGIVTQIENAANERLDAFEKTMEERLKQQEEAHKKAQELLEQQLIHFQTLV